MRLLFMISLNILSAQIECDSYETINFLCQATHICYWHCLTINKHETLFQYSIWVNQDRFKYFRIYRFGQFLQIHSNVDLETWIYLRHLNTDNIMTTKKWNRGERSICLKYFGPSELLLGQVADILDRFDKIFFLIRRKKVNVLKYGNYYCSYPATLHRACYFFCWKFGP